MPHYMQLVVLTDKGRKSFEEDPEWIKSINQEIEYFGGKIETQFALLGQWDFVNIIEAPSDEAAAKLARGRLARRRGDAGGAGRAAPGQTDRQPEERS